MTGAARSLAASRNAPRTGIHVPSDCTRGVRRVRWLEHNRRLGSP